MNRAPGDRQALRARLEWLRLLGVEELPSIAREGSPAQASPGDTEPAPAGPPVKPVVQTGLFAGFEEMDGGGASRPGRRSRGGGPPVSPLTGVRAPEAPDAATALGMIREEIGDCTRCGLCGGRTNIVFGVGNPDARLMFVGEGPGADEDLKGEPFVGRAGQLLTKIIESMGLQRGDVYIANVVKCRPPENRTPLPDEIGTCSPFLFQQIRAIRPRVVVCLGTPAAQTLLGTRETITRLRGAFRDLEGIRVMPTFHPAYLLRNPAAKREVWDDMKKVMAELKAAG
ncbi:MAG TPA: uracil-DNA glycosylase [Candidatus Dormibacteraeota bacterium]|nr:uracil-DNA glycosylase [Candidatus Dormibacteraeota bacterium]